MKSKGLELRERYNFHSSEFQRLQGVEGFNHQIEAESLSMQYNAILNFIESKAENLLYAYNPHSGTRETSLTLKRLVEAAYLKGWSWSQEDRRASKKLCSEVYESIEGPIMVVYNDNLDDLSRQPIDLTLTSRSSITEASESSSLISADIDILD